MKKVSTQTTSFLSVILIVFLSLFALGQLVFCLISPDTVLTWLKNAHVAYYSASTAVAPKMTSFIMNQSFENLFSISYIRVMSLYVFVLCVPQIYALVNVYFISQNGSSNKPFRSSTNECLRSITLAFMIETFFATVLYVIMRLIMRALPFYFMYTMIAVAIYSITMVVFASTISGLINRMGELKTERAKQRKRREEAPAAEEDISFKEAAAEFLPVKEEKAKHTVSTDFDDVLDSIEK